MPKKLTEKQAERKRELAALKTKYKHWGKEEEAKIKQDFVALVEAELERTQNTQIPVLLVTDFQSAAQRNLHSRY